MSREERKRGRVNWFDSAKGYGFITPEEGGKDIFVHFTGINRKGFRSLEPEQRVEFVLVQTEKGWKAEDVCVIG